MKRGHESSWQSSTHALEFVFHVLNFKSFFSQQVGAVSCADETLLLPTEQHGALCPYLHYIIFAEGGGDWTDSHVVCRAKSLANNYNIVQYTARLHSIVPDVTRP